MSDEKGQEIKTPLGAFNFSYRNSPIYLDSPARGKIEKINLPEIFMGKKHC